MNRISDEIRRQRRQAPTGTDVVDDGVDVRRMVRYREALKNLSERDRALIERRLEGHATDEEIAAHFAFPTLAAAGAALRRAIRRLAELLTKKKRD
jgi:hypothetical protein